MWVDSWVHPCENSINYPWFPLEATAQSWFKTSFALRHEGSESKDEGRGWARLWGGWLALVAFWRVVQVTITSFHLTPITLFQFHCDLAWMNSLVNPPDLFLLQFISLIFVVFFARNFFFFRSWHDWFLHVIHDSTQMAVSLKYLHGPSELMPPLYLDHFLGHYNLRCFLFNHVCNLLYVSFSLKPVYCLSPLCSYLSTSVWFMQYSETEYLACSYYLNE